jgi:hypothetical protein
LSDGPPFPTIVHGTKIKEPTSQNDADLLEKLNHNQDTTTDHSLQRTTKSDPLTHLADTLESEMSKESGKTVGDRMHQLERIINAVQNMLEDEEKVGDNSDIRAQRKSAIKSLFDYPLSQLKAQILVAPTGTPPTTHKVFTRPQTLSPVTKNHRTHPFRESNEQPTDFPDENDFDYHNSQNRPSNFHSTIRDHLFSPFNRPTSTEEELRPRIQHSLDPEVHILKSLGNMYSSLFNMMTQEFGDYDGLSLKRH